MDGRAGNLPEIAAVFQVGQQQVLGFYNAQNVIQAVFSHGET